jgi:flagellin
MESPKGPHPIYVKETIMGLRIQNNVEAFNAHRQLTATSAKAAKSMERLSSGYRVNRASDDAAGLAISEKMRSQIGGLAQAQRNAQDAVSLVQTAEGALTEVHSMLQRIRDLKVQFDNGTLDTNDQEAIAGEVLQLVQEIDDIRGKTSFNGIYLLQGDTNGAVAGVATTVTFQVGAGGTDQITASVADIRAGTGMTAVYDAAWDPGGPAWDTAANVAAVMRNPLAAGLALSEIDDAIKEISTVRAGFGAVQNRLEHRLANLATYQENLVASESRIRDVDMASEMVNFSKLQILQQAGTAMLAQANQSSQGVLSLLR